MTGLEREDQDQTRHARDMTEREDERRADDTQAGGERPDPREREQPPQPFSGADH